MERNCDSSQRRGDDRSPGTWASQPVPEEDPNGDGISTTVAPCILGCRQ